ncbi:hypothetical protein ACHAXS_009139 [Conticribra weissflogii]
MQRSNTNKESVKNILSRISQDEETATAVVEEVRNILIRDLQAAASGRGVPRSSMASRQPDVAQISKENINGAVGIDLSASISTKPKDDDYIDGKNNGARTRQKEEGGEDLAFTIGKESETYKKIYSMVQWYRDTYLVGTEFADQRDVQRKAEVSGDATRQNEKKNTVQPRDHYHQKFSLRGSYFEDNQLLQRREACDKIPLSKFTGLGFPYLLSYAQGYIPSQDVVKLLRPSAMWLVSRDGPLLPTATRSMAQTIPLAQSSLDWVMRENLLWVLKDEEWKDFAKGITTKYVRSYKEE